MAFPSPLVYRSALLRAYAAASTSADGRQKARQVIAAQLQGAAEEMALAWKAVPDDVKALDQTWKDLERLRKRLACLKSSDDRWEAEVFGAGERLADGDASCGRDREPKRWGDAWELASIVRQVEAKGGTFQIHRTAATDILSAGIEDAWALLPSPPSLPSLFPDFVTLAGAAVAVGGLGFAAVSKSSEARWAGGALAVLGVVLVSAAPRVALAGAARRVAKAAKQSATAEETEGD